MKRKIAFLLLIPFLIMAVQMNQSATIWTHDEGFFVQYRQIEVRALDTAGTVVIWGKENKLPSKELFFSPYDHSLVSTFYDFDPTIQEFVSADSVFISSSIGGTWGSISPEYFGSSVNNFSYHLRPTDAIALAATGRGVYQSTDGGANWTAVDRTNLNTEVNDVVISPVNHTGSLFNMRYFAAHGAGVYSKGGLPFNNWERVTGMIDEQNFEDVDTTIPGYLDSLPEGWTQRGEDDTYRYVKLDTTSAGTGMYSLLINSYGVGGKEVSAVYDIPDVGNLMFDFDFLPEYHSGIISFRNGMGIDIAFRYGELSYKTSSGDWEILTDHGLMPNKWNNLTLHFNFEAGAVGILTDSTADTIDLYKVADTTVSEVVFSTEAFGSGSQKYHIDNMVVDAPAMAVTAHPDSIDRVFASTQLGVFEYTGTEWNKVLSGKGNWKILTGDVDGNYMVVASPSAIYWTDDMGTNWTEITSGVLPEINDVHVTTNGDVYVATDSFPYQFDYSAGTWNTFDEGFFDDGVMKYVKNTNAITVVEPDTILVGNDNGIYVSTDGGNDWMESNSGINPYEVGSTTVAEVDNYLEESVPSDNSTGLVELLEGEIGPLPDVDNEDILHVVLLDIYEDGADNSYGYFDAVNQDTIPPIDEYSNQMEMLYVDGIKWNSDPITAKKMTARDLAQMIEWNFDADEDDWIVTGYERYADYLAMMGKDSVDYSGIPFSANNIMNSQFAANQIYLWFQYLRDEWGESILDDINEADYVYTDPQTGNIDTIKLQGMAAVDTVLRDEYPYEYLAVDGDTTVHTPLANSIKDWGVKCYLDSISYVQGIVPTILGIGSGGNVSLTQKYFSVYPLRFTDVSNPIVFSGNDNNDFNMHLIEYDGSTVSTEEIQWTDFDKPARNWHKMSVSGVDSVDVLVEVVSGNGPDPANAFYNISREDTVDTMDDLSMLQAPLADQYVTLYYYTNSSRYMDAGSEGGYVYYGSDTTDFTSSGTTSEGYRLYNSDVHLPNTDSTFTVKLESEDIAGYKHTPEIDIAVKTIGTEGGYIAGAGNSMELSLPEGALSKAYRVTAARMDDRTVYVGPNVNLNKKAELSIDISDTEVKGLSLFRKEGDNWVEIPSVRKGGKLEAEIEKLGEYKLMEGNLVTNLPAQYNLTLNKKLNSFSMKYSVPEKGNVRIDVFNSLGQRVKTLVNDVVEPGYYEMKWNGRTNTGEAVSNGVYFYRLSSSGTNITRKTVIVR